MLNYDFHWFLVRQLLTGQKQLQTAAYLLCAVCQVSDPADDLVEKHHIDRIQVTLYGEQGTAQIAFVLVCFVFKAVQFGQQLLDPLGSPPFTRVRGKGPEQGDPRRGVEVPVVPCRTTK